MTTSKTFSSFCSSSSSYRHRFDDDEKKLNKRLSFFKRRIEKRNIETSLNVKGFNDNNREGGTGREHTLVEPLPIGELVGELHAWAVGGDILQR